VDRADWLARIDTFEEGELVRMALDEVGDP
jgi:hypothetical protein